MDDLDAIVEKAAALLSAPRPVPVAKYENASAAPVRPEPGMVCTKRVIRDKHNRIAQVIESWTRAGDPPPVLRSTAYKSFGEPIDRETLRDALGREPTERDVQKSMYVAPADLRVPLSDAELAALGRT